MAAAWFNALADPTKAVAISAGTQPADRVHPEVLQAMHAVGFDLTACAPKLLTPELAATASILVTMGCGDACPVVPGVLRADWPLQDPKGQSQANVEAIRDDVKARVLALATREGWLKGSSVKS
jgi:arsenate reductase